MVKTMSKLAYLGTHASQSPVLIRAAREAAHKKKSKTYLNMFKNRKGLRLGASIGLGGVTVAWLQSFLCCLDWTNTAPPTIRKDPHKKYSKTCHKRFRRAVNSR